jgi:hypothetical protein
MDFLNVFGFGLPPGKNKEFQACLPGILSRTVWQGNCAKGG